LRRRSESQESQESQESLQPKKLNKNGEKHTEKNVKKALKHGGTPPVFVVLF